MHLPLVVVMGVSGSGKSTIGEEIARTLMIDFVDADSLHPPANIAKMASGIALTDEDRWPWLEIVGRTLAAAESTGLVLACSSLKRSYRDLIRSQAPSVFFIHLSGSRKTLSARLARRGNHFMPSTLLDSQLDSLQPLELDEAGMEIDIDLSVPEIVVLALSRLDN
ncbi:MAG TPA: gluconokinase [Candidatus Nanopelagicaceae bacterium]|nr:gluconokinase [Candidatus Nanopelagicaceae bacterium]